MNGSARQLASLEAIEDDERAQRLHRPFEFAQGLRIRWTP
jgi:hypothetical protein